MLSISTASLLTLINRKEPQLRLFFIAESLLFICGRLISWPRFSSATASLALCKQSRVRSEGGTYAAMSFAFTATHRAKTVGWWSWIDTLRFEIEKTGCCPVFFV